MADVSQMFKNSQDTFQKVRTLEDLEHSADYGLVMETIFKWQKLRKDNKELEDVAQALGRMFFYIHNLQKWRDMSETSFSEYRLAKTRAIQRARESDKKVIELEKQIKELKLLVNL